LIVDQLLKGIVYELVVDLNLDEQWLPVKKFE
jgi:hypothetical protein